MPMLWRPYNLASGSNPECRSDPDAFAAFGLLVAVRDSMYLGGFDRVLDGLLPCPTCR
jgi:hypothetical protein